MPLGTSQGSRLIEVAVSLPVRGTYTYRDPRIEPDAESSRLELGTEVIVPFGRRTVTGFVVGHPEGAPDRVRDIEGVVDAAPVLDMDVLALCRWAASYYLAPLGEVLRAALPQGERTASRRRVRLSEQADRLLALERVGKGDVRAMQLDGADRELLMRLEQRGSLSLKGLQRTPEVGSSRIERMIKAGWLEVGDEVNARTRVPKIKVAVVVADAAAATSKTLVRAPARREVFERLATTPDGIPIDVLSTRERAALRALVGEGLAAIEERSRPMKAIDVQVSSARPPPTLNVHQQAAFDAMSGALTEGFKPFLLQGITGSGKTEVYLRLIAVARAEGRGALVLVPEIALTPQLAARFRERFGEDVAVLHSALPRGERLAAWRRLRAGDVGIALGARSAVFAPVRNLGVVVVDEEHDSSFKQDEGVRYHGRDLAIVRAQRAGAVVVMGSATPSLESFRNAESGRYTRLLLPVRAAAGAADRPLPGVEVIDLRQRKLGPDTLLAQPLIEAITATLAAKEQCILFLNRRGFSTVLLCRACGNVVRCPDCTVSMTLHRLRAQLACHYCGRVQNVPGSCPECKAEALDHLGTGTERVQAVVREMFPGARVARLDRDTADRPSEAGLEGLGGLVGGGGGGRGGRGGTGGYGSGTEAILARVQSGEVDILVGTQMVTKGHDFPGVTLVGILQPDQGMHLPDFRAAERTFQLLEQVAGRAGRAEKPGRVLVQTYNPRHPAILALEHHDYEGFARAELKTRLEARYPPYTRLAALRIDGSDLSAVIGVAQEAAERARKVAGNDVRVLGPAEAPIPRLRGRSRYQVWLSSDASSALARVVLHAYEVTTRGDTRVAVDVDPQSML